MVRALPAKATSRTWQQSLRLKPPWGAGATEERTRERGRRAASGPILMTFICTLFTIIPIHRMGGLSRSIDTIFRRIPVKHVYYGRPWDPPVVDTNVHFVAFVQVDVDDPPQLAEVGQRRRAHPHDEVLVLVHLRLVLGSAAFAEAASGGGGPDGPPAPQPRDVVEVLRRVTPELRLAVRLPRDVRLVHLHPPSQMSRRTITRA
eukprot:1176907-Prorocentrum_minimum.AAC.1